MDLSLPPELQSFKTVVRQIVKDQCIPLEKEYLSTSGPRPIGTLPAGAAERLKKVSLDTGIYTAHLTEKYGGGGLRALGAVVGDEETARSIVRLPICHVPNIVIENCTREQEEKYVLPAIRGQMKACFAQTEPHSGSDPWTAMKTTAVKKGGDWIINGAKAFVSDADIANYMMLQAVTDPRKMMDGGITMFLVDRKLPGVSTSSIQTWISPGGATYNVFLDNVRVPDSQVLGELGQGHYLGQRWLGFHDRLMKCSTIVGVLTRGLEMSTDWSKRRVTFGKSISERQAIQWMLVDVYITVSVLRRLAYDAAWRSDNGEDTSTASCLVKLCASEWGWRSIDKIMQVFGGLGETVDMPIPHWYHSLRHSRIGGGTSETMYSNLAIALLEGRLSWEA